MSAHAEPMPVEQALSILNNRHRLNHQELPRYMQALKLARQLGLTLHQGVWYPPNTAE